MTNAIGFLVLAVLTVLHALLVDTSGTQLPEWVFYVYPALFLFKSLKYFLIPNRTIQLLRWSFIVWAILSFVWNVLFLRYTMTESLFTMMVLYVVIVRENKEQNLFGWALIGFGSLILNLIIGDYDLFTLKYLETKGGVYSQPSGTLMISASAVLFYLANRMHHEKQLVLQKIASEDHIKANAIKNMLLALGHTIRTPLTALRLRLETLAIQYPELKEDKNINNQYIDVVIGQLNFLLEQLDETNSPKNIHEWVGRLKDEFKIPVIFTSQESNKREFPKTILSYHFIIAHILIKNAVTHGTGNVKLKVAVFDRNLEYSIENTGSFFNPLDHVNPTGLFNPQISNNNRIGSSVLICYSLADALNYRLQYVPLKSGGTKVIVAPIK